MAREIRKAQYYVEYLGWKETAGLCGREYTEPVVRQLLLRTRRANLPRLTVRVSRKRVVITQDVGGGSSSSARRSSRPEKLSYPPVRARDVTFVSQCSPPDADVAACVFLGYNPMTRCAAHVHVYRFDSPSTASIFVEHLEQIINVPEHRRRIAGVEADLVALGYIARRRPAGGGGGGGAAASDLAAAAGAPAPHVPAPDYGTLVAPPSVHGRPSRDGKQLRGAAAAATAAAMPDDALQQQQQQRAQLPFSSLQEELDYKLKLAEPILLPPKDYDTIVRRHGKVGHRDDRRSRHVSIVGPNGVFAHPKAEPYSRRSGSSGSAASAHGGVGPAIREEGPRSTSSSDDDDDDSDDNNDDADRGSAGGAAPPRGEAGRSGASGPTVSDEVIPPWKTKQGMEYRPPSLGVQRSTSGDSYNLLDASRKSTPRDADPGDDGVPYADGLYTGYAGQSVRSSGSAGGGGGGGAGISSEMVMWSYEYSYGHDTGGAPLPTDAYSPDDDYLARTAPSAFLQRNMPSSLDATRPDQRLPQPKLGGSKKEPVRNSYM